MFTRQVEKGAEHLDLTEVDAIEAVEAQLDAFIEKRAREARDAEKVEELWAQSVRRDRERRRERNREAWRSFHARMQALHIGLAEEHAEKAQALGGGGDP